MKIHTLTKSFAGIAALASLSVSSMAMAEETPCNTESANVTTAVKASPEKVLEIVSAKISASPKCACEIVKAAISAAKADKDLVVSIVEAAAAVAPAELPTVLACAAAEAPEAAAALANKFSAESEGSGKGSVGKESVGKEPTGKGTVTTEEEDFTDDFGLLRPGVGGIYLSPPSTGGSGSAIIKTVTVIKRETRTRTIIVRPPATTPDSPSPSDDNPS